MLTSPRVPGPWLEQWLSVPRLQTYLGATNQDRSRALELYEWNTEMSAGVLHDLAHLEVAMRNAYNDALVARQPGALHWTQQPRRYFPVMMKTARNGRRYDENERPREQIAYAVQSAGRGAPPGKVIAELMFGFWRYLTIAARERTLWLPYLRHGFVAGTSRPSIDGPMARLHGLRNRVAHHEPLLRQNLSARRSDLLALLDRVAPPLRDYVDTQSRWAAVESQRPWWSESA